MSEKVEQNEEQVQYDVECANGAAKIMTPPPSNRSSKCVCVCVGGGIVLGNDDDVVPKEIEYQTL